MRTIFLLVFIVSGCGILKDSTDSTKDGSSDIDRTQELLGMMVGTFDSGQQAESDPSFYDITLHMYPIWEAREDGPWLYVEQAVTQNPASPYRQRIYHLVKVQDQYESRVYEMPSPEKCVGAWRGGTPLDNLTPSDLMERRGCTVYMTYDASSKSFSGSTKEGACSSSLRGATYAESEVSITNEMISSWDRGYNQKKEQVWGAEKGPYIFKRSVDFPD